MFNQSFLHLVPEKFRIAITTLIAFSITFAPAEKLIQEENWKKTILKRLSVVKSVLFWNLSTNKGQLSNYLSPVHCLCLCLEAKGASDPLDKAVKLIDNQVQIK